MIDGAARWLGAFELEEPVAPPADPSVLTEAARTHRLTGLLARAVASGAVEATDGERAEILDTAVGPARRSVTIEAFLARVVERLASEGVSVVVLKGCAVAHLDHAHAADREFIDADVLVRCQDLDAVLGVLQAFGYGRNLPERRPGFDARFAKDITMQRGSGPELDVHVRPAFGPFGQRLDPARLFEHLEPFSLAGVSALALDAPGRVVHASYNALLGDAVPRVVALRDVALMVRSGRAGADAVRERALDWGGEAVVAAAVRRADADLGLAADNELSEWAVGVRPSRLDRTLLRTYPSQGGTFSLCLLAGAIGTGGLRRSARYLAGFAVPSREYRAARREAGRVDEHREGLRQLWQALRPGGARG